MESAIPIYAMGRAPRHDNFPRSKFPVKTAQKKNRIAGIADW